MRHRFFHLLHSLFWMTRSLFYFLSGIRSTFFHLLIRLRTFRSYLICFTSDIFCFVAHTFSCFFGLGVHSVSRHLLVHFTSHSFGFLESLFSHFFSFLKCRSS